MYHNELLTLASRWSDLQSIISHRAWNNENFCLIKLKASFWVFFMSRTGQRTTKYFLRVHIRTFQITVATEKFGTPHMFNSN